MTDTMDTNKQAMNAMGLFVRPNRNIHEDMAAYDALPDVLRRYLQECSVRYNPVRALRLYRQFGVQHVIQDVQRVEDKVREANVTQVTKGGAPCSTPR